MTNKTFYEKPGQSWWQGRNDGAKRSQQRWWQVVQPLLPAEIKQLDLRHSTVLLGFACDEGVRRNKGRAGAAKGPGALRSACCNLPVHFPEGQMLFDAGNILCIDDQLEAAQEQLAVALSTILQQGASPVLLGGGHEIVYGHYLGIRRSFPGKKTGIINFDAHFDLRQPAESGATSGTGFFQIAEDCSKEKSDFLYLAIGIQENSNTPELFGRAGQLGAGYILSRDFHYCNLERIKDSIRSFLNKTDIVYLTIDMDVFAGTYAPGVSAPAANGLVYDAAFYEVLKMLAASKQVVSMDIAELNPRFDIEHRTAKLAANIIFDWIAVTAQGNRSGTVLMR